MAGKIAGTGKALHIPLGAKETPSQWEWARLDDVCTGVFDCPHSTPEKADIGPLMARTQDILGGVFRAEQAQRVSEATYLERTKRVAPSYGDLLYSREGTYFGIAAEVPRKQRVCLGQRMVLIRPNPSLIHFQYLRHWLNSSVMASHILGFRDGSVAERLNLPTIRGLPVLRPSLNEQKAIAHILGTLDDKIELNRRMNKTLEGMARALFKSWFVDFDPVRAKMDGRPVPGLDAATAALFPDGFEHVDGELVPKGWRVTTLGDEISFQGGFAFKSRDWQEDGVPVVKIGSVKPGIIDLTQVSYVSTEIAKQAERYRLAIGDLLIGMTGYVGEVGVVPPTGNLPLLNQRVGKFVLRGAEASDLAFWYCTTRRTEFRSFVEDRSHGTAQANVSATDIMDYTLVMPPESILQHFNRLCQPMFQRILANHAAIYSLGQIRDSLLPRLISGEIRVGDAESKVARHA